jgi:hypothetical protein
MRFAKQFLISRLMRNAILLQNTAWNTPLMCIIFIISALCNEDPNGNVPLGKSCNRYWQCQGGYPRLQRCPAQLVFDRHTLRCVAPPTEDCEAPSTAAPFIEDDDDLPPRKGQQDLDDEENLPPPRPQQARQPNNNAAPRPISNNNNNRPRNWKSIVIWWEKNFSC